jgi:hypothetical protein
MSESWRGLILDSVGHLLSFPTPTRTQIFGNNNNGYGHLKQLMCGVQRIAVNPILQRLRNLDSILELMRIAIFKIANLLIGLCNLMICRHNLIILTKTKETICYCGLPM